MQKNSAEIQNNLESLQKIKNNHNNVKLRPENWKRKKHSFSDVPDKKKCNHKKVRAILCGHIKWWLGEDTYCSSGMKGILISAQVRVLLF